MSPDIETTAVPGQLYRQWVDGLKSLDAEAWDVLLENYAGELRHSILVSLRKRGMSDNLVDDIEQETWLTAVRKIPEFDWENEEKFYHWLHVISLNHIRTYRRITTRDVLIEDLKYDQTDIELERIAVVWQTGGQGGSLEDTIAFRELVKAIDKAMRILKPREREILMRYLMGETPKELAPIYNIKSTSISMLLLRAKSKIKANLTHIQSFQFRDKSDE